jgi:ATP-binding cassette subfamily C protein LapB
MQVYDRVVPNDALDTLWILSLGVFIVAAFDFAMRTLRGRYIDLAGSKADLTVSRRLFERLLGMRLANKPASAGAMAMTLREFETIREFFTSASISVLVDFPFVLIFIAVMGFIGGWLAMVPIVAIPAILLVGYFIQKQLARAMQKSLRQKAHRGSIMVESVTGLEIIKSRTAEGQMLRTWQSVNEAGAATADDIRRYSAHAINFAAFAYMLVYVITIIWGVYRISDGVMTLGALIASSILLGRAMAPVSGMASLLVKLSQSREALERLDGLMQTPVDRPAGAVFHRPEDFRGALELRNVDFAYSADARKVVERLTVKIAAGEKVGIIGPIGCGKSTVARLLLGLYDPISGSVICDGLDIRQLDPAFYRSRIGYVEQSPFLFFGTIRENIAMGHPDVSSSALMQAAETAGVLDFVGDTAQGLELLVAERGENLSGGQRQAICLARALLLSPPVLVLDEPTSAMDPMSEEKFKQRLAAIAANRTLIVLTHRASLLTLVDRLLVMDAGRFVADGPREAVLAALKDGKISRSGQGRSA